jgi:hypothetical protein
MSEPERLSGHSTNSIDTSRQLFKLSLYELMVVSPNMVLSCTASHIFQIQRVDILNRASAKDKTEARAEKRRIKIKEIIFEGTYVHKRVEAPVPTWDWAWTNHGYWDGPCDCADCTLMVSIW